MRVRLVVVVDTNCSGRNLRNCVGILPAFGGSSPFDHLLGDVMQ